MRNSTRTGEPVGVAVQIMEGPLNTALFAILVEIVFVGDRLNVAIQLLAAFIVSDPSLQSASPLHPAKTDPEAAAAVRATTVPLLKTPEQVLAQFIPVGELETVPVPVPAFVTVREKVCVAAGVVAQASGV